MRAKTIIDLMSLSASLYMLAKDHDFLKKSAEHKAEKEKKSEEDEETDSTVEHDTEDEFINRILQNASRLKEGLEQKLDQVAASVYEKMHIAHTDELKKLSEEIAALRTELALTEAKVVNLQQANG